MVGAALGLAMVQEPDLQQQGSSGPLKILQKQRFATPISAILPDDFVLDDQYATSQVTIEDALSHRTGFSGADNLYGRWMGASPKAITKSLRYLGGPSKAFRTKWQYNNLMYSVLGDVLETVTGLQWGAALRKLLWQPLGMSSTFWNHDEVPDDKKESLARGYFWAGDNEKGDFVPERYFDFAGIAPAGSVISNVTDYAKWIGALLKAAKGPQTESETNEQATVITPGLFADLTTPKIVEPILPPMNRNSHLTPRTYSLGWFNLSSTMGIHHPIVAHAGGLNGFGTMLYLLPNDDFGVVTFGNTAMSSHIVGEAVVIEFMARKLELEGSLKAQFVESLSTFDALDKLTAQAEQANEPNKSETVADDRDLRDARLTESLLGDVIGTYNHPAYGPFRVSRPQGLSRGKIVYGTQLLSKDRKELEAHRQHTQTLDIVPLGHRTWGNQFVLHARTPEKNGDSNASKDDVIFFDLEVLGLHGEEVSTEEPSESSISHLQDTSRANSVWETQRLCRKGAALRVASSGWKLGLRLAKEYLAADGPAEDVWEAEMTWFTK